MLALSAVIGFDDLLFLEDTDFAAKISSRVTAVAGLTLDFALYFPNGFYGAPALVIVLYGVATLLSDLKKPLLTEKVAPPPLERIADALSIIEVTSSSLCCLLSLKTLVPSNSRFN